MRHFLVLLALMATLVVQGCESIKHPTESGDVQLVKTGTLPFDKSLTVGQAIDNYKYFKSVRWESSKTENGRRIVQAIAVVDLDKHPTINTTKIPLAKEVQFQFRFVINVDKTFEFDWAGVRTERTDGTVHEPDQKAQAAQWMHTLKAIYANSPDI